MTTDDSMRRSEGWIGYPCMLDLCRGYSCLVYELAHWGLAAPLYHLLNIVFTIKKSLISSTVLVKSLRHPVIICHLPTLTSPLAGMAYEDSTAGGVTSSPWVSELLVLLLLDVEQKLTLRLELAFRERDDQLLIMPYVQIYTPGRAHLGVNRTSTLTSCVDSWTMEQTQIKT